MKKMILVPSELTSQTNPINQILKNLDIEMMNILKREDIPMDQKLRQYNQTLSRYSSLENTKNQPYKLDIIESRNNAISDEEVLNGIPKRNEKLAKALWRFVKKNNRIIIEDDGEVTVDGTTVRGSNIIDLIHDLSRERKTKQPARGMTEFAGALKASNLPLEYVANKNRHVFFKDETDGENSFNLWSE
jgi:hypothetical protein